MFAVDFRNWVCNSPHIKDVRVLLQWYVGFSHTDNCISSYRRRTFRQETQQDKVRLDKSGLDPGTVI